MSVDAYRWAWSQPGLKATDKLLLLALADRAGEDHRCYPSVTRIVADTGINRKTVFAGFLRLEDKGLIKRVRTQKLRVNVYQLIGVEDRSNSTENGTHSQSEPVPKTEPNSTENGTLNPPKSTENGTGTVPKTGHRTYQGIIKQYYGFAPPPEWFDQDLFFEHLDLRTKLGAKNTERAITLLLGKLHTLRIAGNNPKTLIENAIEHSWKSYYPEKRAQQEAATTTTRQAFPAKR